MHEKIIEMFKNSVSQREIRRYLYISYSTFHIVNTLFEEPGEILVCKGKGYL